MDFEPLVLPGVDPARPIVIAGPCSAETEDQVLDSARGVARNGIKLFRSGIWKPRTKPGGFEGVGAAGLAWLKRVKRETGMYVAVEVATKDHVFEALKAGIDFLWVGARTTVNPFAVQEIADALRGADVPVLIKNPVNPDLELWIGAIERIYGAGLRRIGVIHRGFSSYEKKTYRNPPMWHLPIELRRRLPDVPIFCDPSHIAGKRDFILKLCQQAMDLKFDGLIIETHCQPEKAWSDAAQQITPEALGGILQSLVIRNADGLSEDLSELRCRIDLIDEALLELLAKRMNISGEIGRYKRSRNMPVLQSSRYSEIIERRAALGKSMNLDGDFVRSILEEIHEESIRVQMDSE
ncbi:MAG: bifunctional 3-deoxy-7-phosphoheptulonate synthase/chorismate mutase type II [Planctomycetaceae bacterium]|jgi:chorismate mutase|nr:bifunctional 3-deoxy-7-phosphoheptulonate synthase/chorismate mutase type II [Planctomycetaceae bacterium]